MRRSARPLMTKCCPIRRKLGEEFATAVRLYSEAVVALTYDQTLVPGNKFDSLLIAKENARQRSENARVAFNEHVKSHRCLSDDNLSPYTNSDERVA
jgi:hypothetical protein